jgi:hypothetical protein
MLASGCSSLNFGYEVTSLLAYGFEDIKARFKEELLSKASDPISKLNTEDLLRRMIWEHVRGRTLMTTEQESIGLGCSFARAGS